jgi:hypothetical protein
MEGRVKNAMTTVAGGLSSNQTYPTIQFLSHSNAKSLFFWDIRKKGEISPSEIETKTGFGENLANEHTQGGDPWRLPRVYKEYSTPWLLFL